jgi:opacity protein-like surface antigen
MMRIDLIAVLMLATATALAQTPPGRSEFYAGPVFTDGKSSSFEGGTSVKTDTGVGFVLGFGHKFNPKLSGAIELEWGNQDYRATVQPGTGNGLAPVNVNSTMYTGTVRFLGTYNFTTGNFKPFVTGGLGWTYVDTNIPSGLPQNVCWFYPWAGEVCTTSTPTYTTTRFSYNAGAGARYDFGDRDKYFVRGLVNVQWIDFGGSFGTTDLTQYRIDFGLSF